MNEIKNPQLKIKHWAAWLTIQVQTSKQCLSWLEPIAQGSIANWIEIFMVIGKLMIFVKFQILNYVITYEIYVMGFALTNRRLDVF